MAEFCIAIIGVVHAHWVISEKWILALPMPSATCWYFSHHRYAYYNVGIKKIADRYTEMEMVFYTHAVIDPVAYTAALIYEPTVVFRYSFLHPWHLSRIITADLLP